MRVFLGVTGASGAPYAERLLARSPPRTARSGSARRGRGIEVLATELYRDPSLSREEVLERFVGERGGAGHGLRRERLPEPVRQRLGRVDAYVICPCSMATVGTLARARCRT